MSSDRTQPDDVRMRGFAQRTPVAQVTAWLQAQLQPLTAESIPAVSAAGRVLAAAVTSQFNIPGFARAMMDGYAVQAADTSGASPYNPQSLEVIGEALPGESHFGQRDRRLDGPDHDPAAPLPLGADAVLPVEQVRMECRRIWALQEVPPGKHVATPGEDIAAGTVVLLAGRRLRPQDIGVVASIGVAQVQVLRRPHVRVVVTGNELLPPGTPPHGSCIVDSNSPMLAALIERDGGVVQNPGIVPDDPEKIGESLSDQADVVIVSGGSSVGQEDHAPRLLAEQGELVFHGIAMRPSSPTGIGRLGGRWVFLLPGNPVSCLCAYDFFAGPTIRALGGRRWNWPYPSSPRQLRRKLVRWWAELTMHACV